MRKYTKTNRKIESDQSQTDWDKVIRVILLKNQNPKFTFEDVGKRIKMSRQRAHQIWTAHKNKTVAELEFLADKYCK